MKNYYVMLTDEINRYVPNNLIDMMLTEDPQDSMSLKPYPWKANAIFSKTALQLPKELWWIGPLRKIKFDAVCEWGGLIVSEKAKHILSEIEGNRMIISELNCLHKSGKKITEAHYYFCKFSKISDIIDRERSSYKKTDDGQISHINEFIPLNNDPGAHIFSDKSLPLDVYICDSVVREKFSEEQINGIRFLDISHFETQKFYDRKI